MEIGKNLYFATRLFLLLHRCFILKDFCRITRERVGLLPFQPLARIALSVGEQVALIAHGNQRMLQLQHYKREGVEDTQKEPYHLQQSLSFLFTWGVHLQMLR